MDKKTEPQPAPPFEPGVDRTRPMEPGRFSRLPSECRILVADDDSEVRSHLRQILEREGYQVREATDGQDALDQVAEFSPDVVLLDIQMPNVDGVEVCRRLKTSPETVLTPVVLVSGLSDVENRIKGLEAGADDFLSKPFERAELLARVRSLSGLKGFTDELERCEAVLLSIGRSIEGKDPYTEGHCERLSNFSVRLGKRLALPQSDLLALDRGGALHDVGKVAVPDRILFKNGPLTPEEWDVMRMHPVTGEHICAPLRSLASVLPIIRHHHERMDGSGYPDGLVGENIPVTARVLQVVDVFDALTTKRPYREVLSTGEALDVLNEEVSKGWWDRTIVAEFEAMVRSGL